LVDLFELYDDARTCQRQRELIFRYFRRHFSLIFKTAPLNTQSISHVLFLLTDFQFTIHKPKTRNYVNESDKEGGNPYPANVENMVSSY